MSTLPTLSIFVAAAALAGGCHQSGTTDAGSRFTRDWGQFPAVFTATATGEIYALGDLHGDQAAAIRVLSGAGLITATTPFRWTGETRTLIVVGDVIDKSSLALPIIDMFIALEPEARAAGGALVVTLGNHEAEFLADPTDDKSDVFQAELTSRGLDPVKVAAGDSKYGVWLLTRPVAALVDGWFFCHAGNSDGMSVSTIGERFTQIAGPASSGTPLTFGDPFLIGSNSLLEAQLWWQTGSGAVATIDANLAALPAQHIVFGHDPGDLDFSDDPQGKREKGQMVMRYDGRLFLIDVGMSSAVGYSNGALLRILRGNPDQAIAVFPGGSSAVLWP